MDKKQFKVSEMDTEQRRFIEALVGRKLQPGEQVTFQVWPPGVDPDVSNEEKLARLREDVAEGLRSLEEDGPIEIEMEEIKREARRRLESQE